MGRKQTTDRRNAWPYSVILLQKICERRASQTLHLWKTRQFKQDCRQKPSKI